MGVGECLRRVIGKTVMAETGSGLQAECGSDQLCANLEGGIEGAVHAMNELFREFSESEEHAEGGWGVLLVDAANAFNAMNRKAALWHARHLWPQAARFLYNTYKGWAALVMAGSREHLYSREGRRRATRWRWHSTRWGCCRSLDP